ncbi:MAG TPA: alpha/beta hydrolase [Chloroflexia bacterium]|nr:alpha/beta hydrolase [Chloroflexia bacterium]
MTTPEHTEGQHGRYIQANGLDIYYEEHGHGKPLLLIHGGTLTGESWQPYLAGMAEHYRVITPDSRGHGQTANPTGSMSFRLLADDMVALVKALDLQKPLIYGYSDGGQVALEIGMRYPDLAQALVVGGAHLELTEGSRRWVRSILGDEESPEVDFEKFERENPDFAAGLQQDHGPDGWKTLLQQIKPMWNSRLNYTPDDFARIVAPTLVLLGDRDDFVPVEDAVEMYRLLPNAELAVVPGANHTDFIFSRAKIIIIQPLILDFLLRHSDLVAQTAPSESAS